MSVSFTACIWAGLCRYFRVYRQLMGNASRWIGRTLVLALVLQAPLAWAMNCSDHASHLETNHLENSLENSAEKAMAAAMPADCHEEMEAPAIAGVDQSGDCCQGDCPCPTANASFIGDISGSSALLVTMPFQSHPVSSLPLQPSQVPTPPPNS